MGRPPIGKRAMSATERQRRWRANLANKPAKPAPKQVATASGASRALQDRVRKLEAERAALRAELDKLQAEVIRFIRAWGGSWTVTKALNRELETALAREATPDPVGLPKSYRKQYEAARRRQERTFKDLLAREAHRLLDELFLPSFERDDAHTALDNRRAGAKSPLLRRTGYH
jgi:hypothetical protein